MLLLSLFLSVSLASSTSLCRSSTDVFKQFALACSRLNSSFKSSLSFSRFQFPIPSSATVFLRCLLLFCKFSFLKDNLFTRKVFMLGEESMVKVAGHCCTVTASSLSKCDIVWLSLFHGSKLPAPTEWPLLARCCEKRHQKVF